MFQDGTIKRLVGVLREIASERDATDDDKADSILAELKSVGALGDLRHFDMLVGSIVQRNEEQSLQDSEKIIYSSSLKDGEYLIIPNEETAKGSFVTCKCVHCDATLADFNMSADIKSDSITVTAYCEKCKGRTEVYYLGIAKAMTELPRQAETPNVDHGNITGYSP